MHETSPKQSFKHLSILRKALSHAHTGDIIYETVGKDDKVSIHVTVGDLLNDEATLLALEELLVNPISNCSLITEEIDKSISATKPPEALTQVLNDIHWNTKTLEALKDTFLKLPPIDVRMVAMHRHGYTDGLTYLMLYQQSLKDEGFTAKDFFDARSKGTSLEQQIKVLVLGYCLGLINPKVKKETRSTTISARSSVAKRILDKIRGM